MSKEITQEPIEAGDTSGMLPEFGRCKDVERLFGIRKGTLFNLLREGRVKGVLLRPRGSSRGVRLFHLQSVRDYLYGEMDQEGRGK